MILTVDTHNTITLDQTGKYSSPSKTRGRYLRFFELGRKFQDPVEELFVFAKEQWLLRLTGHIEHAKHEDEEYRYSSQYSYRHVLRTALLHTVD